MPKKSNLNKQAINFSGAVNGQIAIGNNNTQTQSKIHNSIVSEDIKILNKILSKLRAEVEENTDPHRRASALQQVQNLEQAITAKTPDLSTMERVKKWFGKNAPALAGTVTSVIVHPVAGKLVEAGGDLLVKEFQKKFGSSS